MPFLIGIDEEVLGMAEHGGLVPDDVVQVDISDVFLYSLSVRTYE